jgi:hypothetical protein
VRNVSECALRVVGIVRSIGLPRRAMTAPPLRACGKFTPGEDEEDIGHEGGGLVAVDTRDGHVRLSGRTAPPAPTVATRALSTCWLSTT